MAAEAGGGGGAPAEEVVWFCARRDDRTVVAATVAVRPGATVEDVKVAAAKRLRMSVQEAAAYDLIVPNVPGLRARSAGARARRRGSLRPQRRGPSDGCCHAPRPLVRPAHHRGG